MDVQNTHTADIAADPQFVNYIRTGGGDYHLKSTSPAIDKGSSVYAPSVDLDGSARPKGAGIDIGAYEYGAAAAPLPTSTPVAALRLSTQLIFGSQLVRTTSAVQFVTITNTGTADLIFDTFSMNGDFTFGGVGTCTIGASYVPGSNCTASVVFKPTASGTRSGILSIPSNASSTAVSVALSGAGASSTK